MGEAAVKVAKACDYIGAGTVEFLLDADKNFYFLEMNTRLQVEHPVTEMITGEDLVAWQFEVAAGHSLPRTQDELRIHGHAFEARIYAEDPDNDFLPASGELRYLSVPATSDHVRVDTGVEAGDTIGVYYDPMIAKLITWDRSREAALDRLAGALAHYRIRGVTTNIRFLSRLARNTAFRDGDVHTAFISDHGDQLFAAPVHDEARLTRAAFAYLVLASVDSAVADPDPWSIADKWRLNGPRTYGFIISVNGEELRLSGEDRGEVGAQRRFHMEGSEVLASLSQDQLFVSADGHDAVYACTRHGNEITLFGHESAFDFTLVPAWEPQDLAVDDGSGFTAPMNGTVTRLNAAPGDRVEAGATILVMEAMKMEHAIKAPSSGVVGEFFCSEGELVEGGSVLVAFESDDQS